MCEYRSYENSDYMERLLAELSAEKLDCLGNRIQHLQQILGNDGDDEENEEVDDGAGGYKAGGGDGDAEKPSTSDGTGNEKTGMDELPGSVSGEGQEKAGENEEENDQETGRLEDDIAMDDEEAAEIAQLRQQRSRLKERLESRKKATASLVNDLLTSAPNTGGGGGISAARRSPSVDDVPPVAATNTALAATGLTNSANAGGAGGGGGRSDVSGSEGRDDGGDSNVSSGAAGATEATAGVSGGGGSGPLTKRPRKKGSLQNILEGLEDEKAGRGGAGKLSGIVARGGGAAAAGGGFAIPSRTESPNLYAGQQTPTPPPIDTFPREEDIVDESRRPLTSLERVERLVAAVLLAAGTAVPLDSSAINRRLKKDLNPESIDQASILEVGGEDGPIGALETALRVLAGMTVGGGAEAGGGAGKAGGKRSWKGGAGGSVSGAPLVEIEEFAVAGVARLMDYGHSKLELLQRPTGKHAVVAALNFGEFSQVQLTQLELLQKPTGAHCQFKTKGGSMVREYCNRLTKDDCRRHRNSYTACDKVHFRRIISPHTDMNLGDCSFLDTCRHMKTCKYVHYELDPVPDGAPYGAMIPPGAALPPAAAAAAAMGIFGPHGGPMGPPGMHGHGPAMPPVVQINSFGQYIPSTIPRPFDRPPRPEYCSQVELGEAQWVNCDIRNFRTDILGQFGVIMADPPWDIHMELPYGTMADDEMRTLNVPGLQTDGLIFLWVTGRAMELGRECLELWGYRRVEEIIWVKTNQLQRIIRTGRTGHWLNHSKEHCLVGIKGAPLVNRNIDTDVIVAEVRETSRKPDEMYSMLERISPRTRKLELFARMHNTHAGWISLGNQLDGTRLVDADLRKRFKEVYPDIEIQPPDPPAEDGATANAK
ncbi:unnamed protein product [Closterium sp. NIES-65]|nr:unnamed protein product [Closterium sp. NIES-65]